MKTNYSIILAFLIAFPHESKAIVTGTIKIVGGMSGGQTLPGSYVNSFPRWTVERTIDQSIAVSRMLGSGPDAPPGEFVDPTSNEELWWPSDLKKLQVRPSLDIFLKSAVPAYVLAGLEVRVPSDASMDGREWKNFGVNCQPLASQWSGFEIAAEKGFRVETFYGSKTDEDSSIDWKDIAAGSNEASCNGSGMEERKLRAEEGTQKAMDLLGSLLGNMDEQSPLVEGMHIISIPITDEWIDLPPNDAENNAYNLVSVGTVESDAKELLKMGEDMLEMSVSSVLNVEVLRIAPGGESEYIPAAYNSLYKK
jgi:hypothetical protein